MSELTEIGYPLTPYGYQLYLLETMMPGETLLRQGLATMRCTEKEMNLRSGEIDRVLQGPFSERGSKTLAILQDAWTGQYRTPEGTACCYRLPLWPDYVYTVLTNDEYGFLVSAEFTRAASSPNSPMLEPWRFTRAELPKYFDRVKAVDLWGHYASYGASGPDYPKPLYLRFGYGLLQEVSPLEASMADIPD